MYIALFYASPGGSVEDAVVVYVDVSYDALAKEDAAEVAVEISVEDEVYDE